MTTIHVPTWRLQDRLARALDEAGISVGEMAEELGVHRNTVSNYLHGRQPNRATLRVWAMRCGVPFEWLLYGGDVTETDTRHCVRAIPGQLSFAVAA